VTLCLIPALASLLQAAAAAAQKKAEQQAAREEAREEAEALQVAAAAEAARRRAAWNEAVRQQWHGLPPPQPVGDNEAGAAASSSTAVTAAAPHAAAGSDASLAAALAAAEHENEREMREQQDREYELSLERDRAKAVEKAAQRKAASVALQQQAQQQQLAALRQALLHKLPPEPKADSSSGGGDGGGRMLTLRVRLPSGALASRQFRSDQGIDDVFDWVYSLPEMPLWAPGTWSLVSGYPRSQLMPPTSSNWAPGIWQQQQQEAGREAVLLPGEWMLQVKRTAGEPLWVKVHEGALLEEVQQEIKAQAGKRCELCAVVGAVRSSAMHLGQRRLCRSQAYSVTIALGYKPLAQQVWHQDGQGLMRPPSTGPEYGCQ